MAHRHRDTGRSTSLHMPHKDRRHGERARAEPYGRPPLREHRAHLSPKYSSHGERARDEPYDPQRPQFVPSATRREHHARLLAEGFRLVDEKPDPENVGIFQGIFALVSSVDPELVSEEHRARHEFLACMRGVQCLLQRMAAPAVS